MSELTLEKQRVVERLTVLETKFDGIDVKIDTMYKCLVGNGELGLKTKMELLIDKDRQRDIAHNRIWTAIIGSFVTFVGKIFFDILKK